MATLLQRLTDAFTAVKTETKALRTFISGTNNGDTSGLNAGLPTNLVAAINTVDGKADAAASSGYTDGEADARVQAAIGSFATPAANQVASTQDLVDRLDALKSEILGGVAPAADTLLELFNEIQNTDTENDNAFDALVVTVGNKANASDIYTQAQLGDPDTDLVAIWDAA